MKRGEAFERINDFSRANRDYSSVIESDTTRVYAWGRRGMTYLSVGKLDEAYHDFNKSIELAPNDFLGYFNRGNVFFYSRRFREAITDFSKTIELHADDFQAHLNRGNCWRELQEYEKALSDYSVAISIDINYVNAYLNRGSVFLNLKDYDKAITDFNKVLELDPVNASAYANRAIAYEGMQEYDKALEDSTKAISLNPSFHQAYFNRGMVYLLIQEHSQALTDFTKSIELFANPDAYYWRAEAAAKLHKFERAIRDWKTSGFLYMRYRNYDVSVKSFKSAYDVHVQNNVITDDGLVSTLMYYAVSSDSQVEQSLTQMYEEYKTQIQEKILLKFLDIIVEKISSQKVSPKIAERLNVLSEAINSANDLNKETKQEFLRLSIIIKQKYLDELKGVPP